MFDPNKKDFPSYTRRNLYRRGVSYMPAAVSLKNVPEESRPAFLDFCNFKNDLLLKIYENPEKYNIDVRKIEDNLHGLTIDNARTVARTKKQEERLKNLEEFNKTLVINDFLNFVNKLDFDGNIYYLTAACYNVWISAVCKRLQLKKPAVTALLEESGFCFDFSNRDRVVLSNVLYPRLFEAAYLIKVKNNVDPQKAKKLRYGDFASRLDFTYFNDNYVFDINDYFYCMSDEEKRFVTRLNNYLEARNFKIGTCHNLSGIAIGCSYKGRNLFRYRYSADKPEVSVGSIKVHVCNAPTEAELVKTPYLLKFEELTRERPDADKIIDFFKKNRNACRKCGGPSCCGNVHPKNRGYGAHVFGDRLPICAGIYRVTVRNFTDETAEMCEKIMDIIFETEKYFDESRRN